MLRDGRPADRKVPRDFRDRAWSIAEEAKDGAPRGVAEGVELLVDVVAHIRKLQLTDRSVKGRGGIAERYRGLNKLRS